MMSTTKKRTFGRTLTTLLLAGALASGGVAVAQLAAAPEAEAAACGGGYKTAGYAYMNNPCGTAYAEVARKANGKIYAFSAKKYKGAVSVSSSSGARYYEAISQW